MADKSAPDINEVVDIDLPEMLPEIKTHAESLTLSWTEDEEETLSALKMAADNALQTEFSEPFAIMKSLQHKVRVQEDIVDGKVIWRRNPDGSIYENWRTLTVADMDAFVMQASAWTYFGGFQVIDSYADAVFAKFLMDERYDAEYSKQLSGHIPDKTAKANSAIIVDKYRAFFRNIYYKKAKAAVDRLEDMVRRVERIATMQRKDAERNWYANNAGKRR